MNENINKVQLASQLLNMMPIPKPQVLLLDRMVLRRYNVQISVLQLVDFPEWWMERTSSCRGGPGSSRGGHGAGHGRGFTNNFSEQTRALTTQVQAAHATSSNSYLFPKFTQEQWRALTQLISERTNGNSDKLSDKSTNNYLFLDTGVSHHMMGDFSLLAQMIVISPCPVGFLDCN